MQKQSIQFIHKITFPRAGTGVEGLAWSPDSQFLASASRDGVLLWKASTGEARAEWGRTGYVGSIAWSPTGKNLAVGTVVYRSPFRVGMVRLWQFPKGGSLEKSIKKKALCNAGDPVSAVSWSPDGTRLAVPLSGGKVSIVDVLSERELFQYQATHSISTEDIAWSPDGTRIASLGCGGHNPERELTYLVSLYHLSDGSITEVGQGTNYLTSLVWSPDSTRLVIIGSQTIKLWNDASSHLMDSSLAQLGGGNAVAWSPDGQFLAIARGNVIHIWEADTERTCSVLQTNATYGSVKCVKWSPDGQSLAAGDSERAVSIWPLESMVPA